MELTTKKTGGHYLSEDNTVLNTTPPNRIIGQIYTINNQLFRCEKIRESGINTFQLVDDKGNKIVKKHPKYPAVVLDHGVRLINIF